MPCPPRVLLTASVAGLALARALGCGEENRLHGGGMHGGTVVFWEESFGAKVLKRGYA
jgi:hypothetical protein